MEETILVSLQDERQRRDGRSGPVRVSRVRQKGTVSFKLWIEILFFTLKF